MELKAFSKSFSIGEGKDIKIETGKMARQADGSVLLKKALIFFH